MEKPENTLISKSAAIRVRISSFLSAKQWAGIGVIVTIILAIVASNQAGQGTPLPSSAAPPTSGAPPSVTADLDCLAYTGSERELSAYIDYAEQDFTPVDCVNPHQFETVTRTGDVSCEDAVVNLVDLYAVPGFKRHRIAEYGPSSCAVGRMNREKLQTDTYRITANTDILSVFGSCIEPEDVDAFLAGSADHGRNVPCQSGKVLPASWSLSGESTAEESCAENAELIPNRGIRSAASSMEDGASGAPAVLCAYALWGVDDS